MVLHLLSPPPRSSTIDVAATVLCRNNFPARGTVKLIQLALCGANHMKLDEADDTAVRRANDAMVRQPTIVFVSV